jgi:hypothetical protein
LTCKNGTPYRQIAQIELTVYALGTKGAAWLAERQDQTYIDFYSHLIVDQTAFCDPESERIGKSVFLQDVFMLPL